MGLLGLSGLLGLVGCNGDDGRPADDGAGTGATDDSGGSMGTADAGETEGHEGSIEQTVPLDVASLPLEAQCFSVHSQPSQLSVTPQGHLWMRQSEEIWRVLDPFGRDQVQHLPPGVGTLQARGHDRAVVIDGGVLWTVQGQWPQPLAWPQERGEPTLMCGDPSADANGFVVADGLLHRDGGQWWEWTDPSDESWTDVAWMARNAGTCIGGDGELWLAEGGGEVWRITGDFAARVEAFDGSSEAVLVDGLGVAALRDGEVVAGDIDSLTHYRFEAGSASALSSGGESLWVVVEGVLHRLRDGEFTVAMLDGAPVEADIVQAEAGGGVWMLAEREACHLRPTSPVRIEGVYNLQRLASESVEIAVEVAPGASLATVTLDGEALAMAPDGEHRWRAEPQAIATGWHTLEVLAENDEQSEGADEGARITRHLRFEQRRVGELTWVGDIEPIFAEHCSGAACHGPMLDDATRPDLSSWDAWIDREDSILDRVVTKGDMPPAGSRKDTWGLELQLRVSEWFETGAEHGDG